MHRVGLWLVLYNYPQCLGEIQLLLTWPVSLQMLHFLFFVNCFSLRCFCLKALGLPHEGTCGGSCKIIGRFDNTWLFNVVLSRLPESWTFCKVCPRYLYFFYDCDPASATSKNWSIKLFLIKAEEICGSTCTSSPDISCTMCFLAFIVHLSKI